MSSDRPGGAPRDWRLFLDDIVEACDRIREYTAGLGPEQLVADGRTYDAVLFNGQIVGEAARRLPEWVRALAPAIPGRDVTGIRNRIVHGYFAVDDEVVWNVVTTELAPLRAEAARLRDAVPPPSVID